MKLIYKNTSQIEKHELLTIGTILESYIKQLRKVAKKDNYRFDESSINLPFDADLLKDIKVKHKKLKTEDVKYIIDIGIGGSNLGTKAIYDALFGYFDLISPTRFPKIIFVDTNASDYLFRLRALLKALAPKDVLINVVSKSGKTTEVIANLEMVLSAKNSFKKRLIITTDVDTELWSHAKKQKILCFPIPHKIGGRYSVFSAVGLVPLLIAGVNILNLLEGAMEIRSSCLETDLLKNPAAISAISLYLSNQSGKRIHDTFLFHPELESLGKWYRQLMGESIGKEGVGITPTVSIGSVDLHSMGQLYLGGPKDKFFTLVSSRRHKRDVSIPKNTPFPLIVQELRGKSAGEIMSAIHFGVKSSFVKNDVPFVEIVLNDISEKSLGAFMQFKMIEMMYLGKLFGVNAFNQPNVESYKIETKKRLSGQDPS